MNFNWAPKYSVRNSFLVNICAVLVVLFGVGVLFNIPKEFLPAVSGGMVRVSVMYRGATAHEVEKLITIPLEQEINHVSGLDHIQSFSYDGMTVIDAMVSADEDVGRARLDIQAEVQKVVLPEDADPPTVQEVKFRSWQFMQVGIYGNGDERHMNTMADYLRDRFTNIKGVERVAFSGKRDDEVWVEVDPTLLEGHGLTLSAIIDTIRQKAVNIPAGFIESSERKSLLRTVGDIEPEEAIRRIGEIVLKMGATGDAVTLRDVAKITRTFVDPDIFRRVDGNPAIVLDIFKKDSGNIVFIADEIKKIVEQEDRNLAPKLRLKTFNDNSEIVTARLDNLGGMLLGSVVLLLALLFTFFNIRVALFITWGLIITLCGSLICMGAGNLSLNAISMMSFMIILGLGVSNGIVVGENVYRHMTTGLTSGVAAVVGTSEVFWPVIASTATTVAAFLPLLIVPDLRKFWGDIGWVLVLALIWSTLAAFLVLPSNMADFCKSIKMPKKGEGGRISRLFDRLRNGYVEFVRVLLKVRYLTCGVAVAVVAFSIYLATAMPFKYLNIVDVEEFAILVKAPEGTKIEETHKVMLEIERKVLQYAKEHGEIRNVSTTTGFSRMWGGMRGENRGQVELELVPYDQRKQFWTATRDDVRKLVGEFTGVELEYHAFMGPAFGNPLEVRARGDDFETLQKIAGEVEETIAKHPRNKGGIRGFKNYEVGKDEVSIVPDEELAKIYGLDTQQIGRYINQAINGETAVELKGGRKEIDVRVRLPKGMRMGVENLSLLMVPLNGGGTIPLDAVTKKSFSKGVNMIPRYDLQRAVTYNVSYINDAVTDLTSQDLNNLVRERFADISLRYPGYSIQYGGLEETREETMAGYYRSIAIGVLLIYITIGAVFRSFIQPFVIMLSIPLSLTGGVFALYLLNEPMSLIALIGFITLLGVGVNDSIVYVSFINNERKRGVDRWQSILNAGRLRFQQIFLTTFSTIVGLLTISMAREGINSFMSPIGIVIVWGMISEAFLTLLVIPSFVAVFDDFHGLFTGKKGGFVPKGEEEVAELEKHLAEMEKSGKTL